MEGREEQDGVAEELIMATTIHDDQEAVRVAREPAIFLFTEAAREYLQQQQQKEDEGEKGGGEGKDHGEDGGEGKDHLKEEEEKTEAVTAAADFKDSERPPSQRMAVERQAAKSPKQAKKSAMRPSADVIRRISWDKSMNAGHMTVGYDDRFIGIIEKPFLAFNWADFVSLSHTETAIPQHRIIYFKYRDLIVWDRRSRLDHIFGSTGGPKIQEVMAAYDAEHGSPPAQTGEDSNNDDNEEETDDAAAAAAAAADGCLVPTYDNSERPNFFIAIRCDQPSIAEAARAVQKSVIAHEPRLKEACLPCTALHLTLVTLRVDRPEELANAQRVLAGCREFLAQTLPNQQPLTIEGVECYRERVLVARLPEEHQILLTRLVSHLLAQLQLAGLRTPGNRPKFVAHMTLVKMSRQLCRSLKRIPPQAYCSMDNTPFGLQSVEELHLCHMTAAKGLDGFYLREGRLVNTAVATLPLAAVLEQALPEPSVVILRGLPGSGKSSLAAALPATALVCSADDHLTSDAGVYAFDRNQLPMAHKSCWLQFTQAVTNDLVPLVVVDNTHSRRREFQRYVDMAHAHGYAVRVLEVACPTRADLLAFAARGRHQVPLSALEAMRARWEPYPDATLVAPWYGPTASAATAVVAAIPPAIALPAIALPSRCYSAVFLTPASRAALLAAYPPSHSTVLADHMTLVFQPSVLELGAVPVGRRVNLQVLGVAADHQGQAARVRVLSNNLALQSLNLAPHVTISTAAGVPAVYSNELLRRHTGVKLQQPGKPLVLEGLVGMAMGAQRAFSPEQLQCLVQARVQLESQPTALAVGGAVTALFIFDFDLTLFETCSPAKGQALYRQHTGQAWSQRGWVIHPESLQPPIPVTPGPLLPLFHRYCGRAHSYTVVMSGRIEPLRSAMQDIFAHFGMQPDELVLKPDAAMETATFKLEALATLLRRFPNLQQVTVWDDNRNNLRQFANFEHSLNEQQQHMGQAATSMKVIDSLTVGAKMLAREQAHPTRVVQNFLLRRGLLRCDAFSSAAEDGLCLLHVTWQQTLATMGQAAPVLSSSLVVPLGSFELARASDVDLCLLGPSSLNHRECILQLAEQLERCGVTFTYAATQARCPRLRVRLFFPRMRSIDYDVLFVLLAPAELANVPADPRARLAFVQQHAVDPISEQALQGCLFLQATKDRLAAAGVKVQTLSLTVELMAALLRTRGLVGSQYHALRTFHIVQLVLECLPSLTGTSDLPGDGCNSLTAELWVGECVRQLADYCPEKWQAAVDASVAAQWLPMVAAALKDAHVQLAPTAPAMTVELLETLTAAPPTPAAALRVDITAHSTHSVLLWQLQMFAAGRLSSYLRKLMDMGHTVSAGNSGTGTLASFYVQLVNGDNTEATELMAELLEPFWSELVMYRRAGVQLSITGRAVPPAGAEAVTVIFSEAHASESLVNRVASGTCQRYLQDLNNFAAQIMTAEGAKLPVLEFPPSLTSTQRWLIHQRAEELGLVSKSRGIGHKFHHVVVHAGRAGDPGEQGQQEEEKETRDIGSGSDIREGQWS